jgi:hypothetical protein
VQQQQDTTTVIGRSSKTKRESTKLFGNGHINTGSEQLQMLRNNPTQRFRLGGSNHRQGKKGMESIVFHNANIQKWEE